MIHIDLDPDELQYLEEELNGRLTDLDHEIAHTDSAEFRDMLKRHREALRRFLAQVPNSPVMAI